MYVKMKINLICDCVGVILINFVAATADDVRGGSGDCDGGWQRL